MPPRKKATSKGQGASQRAPTTRQQAAAKAKADRVARAAQRAEAQESVHEVDQNFGDDAVDASIGVHARVDQNIPGVAPATTPRPLTIEDLLQVITHMQQQQQPQPPPPPPPQYDRGPAATVTDFVRLQPPVFTGEGDPMIAEKWLDQIDREMH